MYKIILTIEGMHCPMCEAHVNEAIKKAFKVKKVSSSHKQNQTIIICDKDIANDKIKSVIDEIDYDLKSIRRETEDKKGLLSLFKK